MQRSCCSLVTALPELIESLSHGSPFKRDTVLLLVQARLLRCVLCNAPKPHCNEWVREILTILVPLAGRSRLVAHLLISYLPALEQLLTTCEDPLCVSLGEKQMRCIHM